MKRYTVVYNMANGDSYTEIVDKASIEMADNEARNHLLNPFFILKNSDGISRIMTAHVTSVDIFEGSDVV